MRAKSTFFFAVVALMLATVVVCGCSTLSTNTAVEETGYDVTYEDLWRNETAYVGRNVVISGKVISDTAYMDANGRQVGDLRLIQMYYINTDPFEVTSDRVCVIYRPNGTRYMSGDYIAVLGRYNGITEWEMPLLKAFLGDGTVEMPTIRAHIIYLVTEDGGKKSYVS